MPNIPFNSLGLIFWPYLRCSEPDSNNSRGVETMEARTSHLQTSQGLLSVMSCVYVGNSDACVSEQELEDEFQTYKVIRRI